MFLSRQNIGPFDVANLAATDTNALKNWLDDNEFQLDESVIELMQPYMAGNIGRSCGAAATG